MSRDQHRSSGPSDPTRRKLLSTAAIGVAAAATAAALGTPAAAQDTSTSVTAQPSPEPTGEFTGQCAFITGGARGIGYACAEEFAKAGANIVLYDIAGNIDTVNYPLATEQNLATAKSNIEALGVKCIAIKGDVRDSTKLEESVARTVREFGRLDILIVNAGVTHVGVIDEFPDEEVQTVIDINLTGAIKTTQAALPIMRRQNAGRIVMISSILGRIGNEDFSVYASTKWGLIGFAKSTALAMAKHNVTCNAVCPGWVRTKLADNDYILNAVSPENPNFEAVSEAAEASYHPLPIGAYEPVDIARVVKMFCGQATAMITGEVFDISQGQNARFNA
ncbi:MAG: SDR family NAD(P)-dependent oxidoreductase [Pleurocapsa sp. MO_226.B13]|nr:SDR family NAD(P)-dependent oxidoreductase [Pleurocapsa sp. MO_226.B13]